MMIKNFGARVISVWEGLRPMTQKMLVGALQTNVEKTNTPTQKFSYDTHTDWELSRLLSALDEQANDAEIKKDTEKLNEIRQLADTCAKVLQDKTKSAEVYIQLVERALTRNDYNLIDRLGDILVQRFSIGEIAEIIRQTKVPHICAIAYETLALKPVQMLLPLLDDPIYFEIGRTAIEQQAFEFDSMEAQRVLEEMDFDDYDDE